MDLRKIKKLIELVEESGIAELEVKSGDEAVRIARPVAGMAPIVVPAAELPAAPASAVGQTEPTVQTPAQEIRAPMAGTFYAASEPGAPAFCELGNQVAVGDVVCIIESMKMMNEIRAEQPGAVIELLVANAEPVSSGQVLMRLR